MGPDGTCPSGPHGQYLPADKQRWWKGGFPNAIIEDGGKLALMYRFALNLWMFTQNNKTAWISLLILLFISY